MFPATMEQAATVESLNSGEMQNLIEPNCEGLYFVLAEPVVEKQQRERIIICSQSKYPHLFAKRCAPRPARLVETDILPYDWDPSFRHQPERVTVWPEGQLTVELQPKSPKLLSSNIDHEHGKMSGSTGFYLHFKIFTFDEKTRSYQLLDELTSSVFRTISHSKLATITRRANPKVKKGRRPKVRYRPYNSSNIFK